MAEKKEYTASRKVEDAEKALEAQKNTRPEYRSGWENQLAGIMDRILNREEFRYSLDGDALYRQYMDQAARNGKLAMADTMAQAAAMTGGYGNSYAQTAGQQAYARQLDSVNDRIPELYALALEQYRQQTQGLQQKYDLLAGMESRDYSRYQDALSAWQQEADALYRQYTDSRDFDYGMYRDDVADWQWQTEFDEDLRRYDQEWAAKHHSSKSTSSVRPAADTKETVNTAVKDVTTGEKSSTEKKKVTL